MWFRRRNRFDEILREYVDGDFSVFAAGDNAPSDSVVGGFETSLGYGLPQDFREFSTSRLGGVYIAVKAELWPRPKEFSVGPFWSFLYGVMAYGFGAEIPEEMDMRIQTSKFKEATRIALAPFFKVIGDADVYCFDENQKIRRWDHEICQAKMIEKTFTEVFAYEVAELRKRKDRKLGERKTA